MPVLVLSGVLLLTVGMRVCPVGGAGRPAS